MWFDVGIKRYTTRCWVCRWWALLWFDVGIKRYTTSSVDGTNTRTLWFDVGIKRYTTSVTLKNGLLKLWFDVGIKRYTTNIFTIFLRNSCGLMYESKDIQQASSYDIPKAVVVWCRNQKIYNPNKFNICIHTLWFDVGIKRYTTFLPWCLKSLMLWFDVGIKRYTTSQNVSSQSTGCGLM